MEIKLLSIWQQLLFLINLFDQAFQVKSYIFLWKAQRKCSFLYIHSFVLVLLCIYRVGQAYARHLFSADWSDDFHRLDMTEAERKVEQFDKMENLKLTDREKYRQFSYQELV